MKRSLNSWQDFLMRSILDIGGDGLYFYLLFIFKKKLRVEWKLSTGQLFLCFNILVI